MEEKEPKKLSYEQLEKVAIQFQQRAVQAENKLRNIDMGALRLEYLFKVINLAKYFPETFVDKCVKETIDILDISTEEDKEVNGED